MSDNPISELMYAPPQVYSAVVTDRWGSTETTLVNDGQTWTLGLRGRTFSGETLDGLDLVSPLSRSAEPLPDLDDCTLCSYTLEWRMPIRVLLLVGAAGAGRGSGRIMAPLDCRLVLGPELGPGGAPKEDLVLALRLPTGAVATRRVHGFFDDALLDLQRQIAGRARIEACITCAFGSFQPGGGGLIGTMGCFRDCKDAYRAVRSKSERFAIWGRKTGYVQETFHCPQYEPDKSTTR
jgi:hypothetical protein